MDNVQTVAENLLGKILVKTGDPFFSGRIVEVEAYQGKDDEAAHSYGGKTARNSVMFEEGGLLYVYLIYGIHFCANVVTGKAGEADAVLIRALEPLAGIDKMFDNRFNAKNKTEKNILNLTNGPAKLCQAFGIARKDNGTDLTGGKIFLAKDKNPNVFEIVKTTRIGISKSKDLKRRFYIKGNPFVSVK
ncbi:MAG: DNA-3-methyladenine glycosylase [Chlorobi bacterium]|nr:DNA-3-methyladenine glycosylase [Chlorobiota bacterium]